MADNKHSEELILPLASSLAQMLGLNAWRPFYNNINYLLQNIDGQKPEDTFHQLDIILAHLRATDTGNTPMEAQQYVMDLTFSIVLAVTQHLNGKVGELPSLEDQKKIAHWSSSFPTIEEAYTSGDLAQMLMFISTQNPYAAEPQVNEISIIDKVHLLIGAITNVGVRVSQIKPLRPLQLQLRTSEEYISKVVEHIVSATFSPSLTREVGVTYTLKNEKFCVVFKFGSLNKDAFNRLNIAQKILPIARALKQTGGELLLTTRKNENDQDELVIELRFI